MVLNEHRGLVAWPASGVLPTTGLAALGRLAGPGLGAAPIHVRLSPEPLALRRR